MILIGNRKPSSLMRVIIVLGLMVFSYEGFSQTEQEQVDEIRSFQSDQNEHYLSKKSSPLTRKERKAFHGHDFYTIDLSFIVNAAFEYIEREDTVEMSTSSGNIKYYRPYALLKFELGGVKCQLTAYQSLKLRETVEYKNYLFVPFRDLTSGNESYGGGRYLDLVIPSENSVQLNFNLSYNPYCAYTAGYNCTIPPAENTLPIAVRAGVKAPPEHELYVH